MKPLVIYCYDAYCGWCYGFSPVITRLFQSYKHRCDFEVLSGGMIPAENPAHIGKMAGYIAQAYKQVEAHTGVRFGDDYLWHIHNPDKSDWFPASEKPAIALSILKEKHRDHAIDFAADLQFALHCEGRDLCDDEAYRHLLKKYNLDEADFYQKLHDPLFQEMAYYDFALCKQLQVTGFPSVLVQAGEQKFYAIARGYTPYAEMNDRLEKVLEKLAADA
jgi:putative protein-disulfide isomerase